jgi:hypothetical protein
MTHTTMTLAEKFRENYVTVENINGWNYYTTNANPADFGAVAGYDADITMYDFYIFPDGSCFAIVPGQVGNSISVWELEVPTYRDLHDDNYELVTTANECTCQLWKCKRTGIEYVVLVDNSVITRHEDNSMPDAIFPY